MTDIMDRARELRQRVNWSSNEAVKEIADALLAAEQRGAERQRERIAQRYDAAADEFDKQAIEAMSVADKLRLDTLAANHRQFAAAIRNQETSQ